MGGLILDEMKVQVGNQTFCSQKMLLFIVVLVSTFWFCTAIWPNLVNSDITQCFILYLEESYFIDFNLPHPGRH